MARLVDADALSKLVGEPIEVFLRRLDLKLPPTVDAVEVVRCKDCKHYYADPWGWGNCVFEGGVSRRTKTNDFCSWGERKDEVTE